MGRVGATLLAGLLLIPLLSVSSIADHRQNTSVDEEEMLSGFQLDPDDQINIQFESRGGEFWLEADCGGDCRGLIMTLSDGVSDYTAIITDGADLDGELGLGSAWLNLSNDAEEQIKFSIQGILPVVGSMGSDDGMENVDSSATRLEMHSTSPLVDLLKTSSSSRGMSDPLATWFNISMGEVTTMYWPLDIEAGDVIELSSIHASSDVELSIIEISQGDQRILTSITRSTNTSVNSEAIRNWTSSEVADCWLKATSSHSNTSFSARVAVHTQDDDSDAGDWPDVDGPHEVLGLKEEVLEVAGSLATADVDVIMLNASGPHLWSLELVSTSPVDINVTMMVDGIWVPFIEERSTGSEYPARWSNISWTPEATTLLKIRLESDIPSVWGLNAGRSSFGDLGGTEDADGAIPLSLESAQQSLQTLEMGETINHVGWLSLPIYDGADMFLLNLSGWEESRYRVKVEMVADNTRVKAEVIEMDWSDRSIISSAESSNLDGISSTTQLEVGQGHHLVKVSSIEIAQGGGWVWGSRNVSPISWSIVVHSIQTEEGKEPWFEAEEFMFDISNGVLWFMGFLLLAPLIWVVWINRIHAGRARELASGRRRLEELREMLASGRTRQARTDLRLSLRSMSSLDWEEAIATWGETDARHRTEDLELAIWRLPHGISRQGGIPVLVGLHIVKGTLEVVGLRFEVSEGEHWKVASCQPRFLNRGDEVFLDSLSEGSRTFVQVELVGSGSGLEVSISGLSSGEPIAAKNPDSIPIGEEE